MGEAQNGMWLFFKNFSNKFSFSDLVNGNQKGNGSTGRKCSYNRLDTNDKGDSLSSSNPNLADIVGKEEVSVETNANNTINQTPTTSTSSTPKSKSIPASLSSSAQKQSNNKPKYGAISTALGFGLKNNTAGRNVDFNSKTKKFTFPNRVPNAQKQQQDEDKERRGLSSGKTNITENVKDSNWLEDEESEDEYDDVTSSCSNSSDYEDDEDTKNGTRCGICGCEKKYEVGCSNVKDL